MSIFNVIVLSRVCHEWAIDNQSGFPFYSTDFSVKQATVVAFRAQIFP